MLIHGSSVTGVMMHPLAEALQRAGATVYTLDLRGHGASGKKGDIAYVGQLDDDVADFLAGPCASPAAPMATASTDTFCSRRFSGRTPRRSVPMPAGSRSPSPA